MPDFRPTETPGSAPPRSIALRLFLVFLFLLLLVIPIGAFVEIDEKELRETRARNSLRVLAAGSGINFIVAAVCFVLVLITVKAIRMVWGYVYIWR